VIDTDKNICCSSSSAPWERLPSRALSAPPHRVSGKPVLSGRVRHAFDWNLASPRNRFVPSELMPRLPNDDPMFSVDRILKQSKYRSVADSAPAWQWRADDGTWKSYTKQDNGWVRDDALRTKRGDANLVRFSWSDASRKRRNICGVKRCGMSSEIACVCLNKTTFAVKICYTLQIGHVQAACLIWAVDCTCNFVTSSCLQVTSQNTGEVFSDTVANACRRLARSTWSLSP